MQINVFFGPAIVPMSRTAWSCAALSVTFCGCPCSTSRPAEARPTGRWHDRQYTLLSGLAQSTSSIVCGVTSGFNSTDLRTNCVVA